MVQAVPDQPHSLSVRPVVGISRCLGFGACRWDGTVVPSAEVTALTPHVSWRPICPEVEMGLGVPRAPIRIMVNGAGRRLVQPATGRDLTAAMDAVVERFAASLDDADGLLLKSRSPSCAWGDARVYPSATAEEPLASAAGGAFAAGILLRLAHLAVEDEIGLTQPTRRDHFLTRLFTGARLRAVRVAGTRDALVRFQTDNKLLLMAYDKRRLGLMGKVVATLDARPMAESLDTYAGHLHAALARPARASAHVNALLHAAGYLRHAVPTHERDTWLALVERYRRGEAPLSACLAVLRSWVTRSGQPYLARQTYLRPYPEDLARAG